MRTAASRAVRALRARSHARDGSFDCVHMRRRDFVADHPTEEVSVDAYAKKAAHKLRAWRLAQRGGGGGGGGARPLYLASDVADEVATRLAFERHVGSSLVTLLDVFPAGELDTFTATANLSRAPAASRAAALSSEMRLGNVDQLLCSAAEHFVGNKWSSFTHHVCYLRQLRGVADACKGSDIYGRDIDRDMEYV